MAMTDAEKEAKILEIGELCAEISRTNQLLLDIFRAGGVANANWAVMKAELKAWVTTQLNGYTTLATAQTLSGAKTFAGDVIIKGAANVSSYNTGLTRIYFNDVNDKVFGDVIAKTENGIEGDKSSIYFASRSLNSNGVDVSAGYAGLVSYKDNAFYPFFYVPTPWSITNKENYDDATRSAFKTAAVNIDWLAAIGNFLVHKFGSETIRGNKEFLDSSTQYGTLYLKTEGLLSSENPSSRKQVSFSMVGDSGYAFSQDYIYVDPDGSVHREFLLNARAGFTGTSGGIYIVNEASSANVSYISLKADKIFARKTVPAINNTYSLGDGNSLWSEVYASNGTIQTSDKNLKTEIADVPEAVMRAWSKVKFKQFKMKDAVTKKKANARVHIGVIANEDADSIQQAFASEGLDAHDYGLFCYDEWTDQYEDVEVLVTPEEKGMVKIVDKEAEYIMNEDGTYSDELFSPEVAHMEEQIIKQAVYKTEKKLVQAAGHRYSVRYEECLALECAYQRWVLKKIADKVGMAI